MFDLNNLRIINNNLGHEKGDEYIRSFAVQLRGAMTAEHFVGRDGGDESLTVIRGLEREAVEACLSQVRSQTAEYSADHPEMPISYAAGYAISSDFESCSMRAKLEFPYHGNFCEIWLHYRKKYDISVLR